ncbi:zinc-binding protein A33-like [Alosa alosa]|uniref:zinc-binding protein A33-like n=1 Tax=Alosa alosa TaxID=278164 RepID=UPI00201516E1|nr:zinc-binding protein A33-like [Alosa alosa]
MDSVLNILRTSLDTLTAAQFKKFKHHVKDLGPIPWGNLEKSDSDDTLDLIVQAYTINHSDGVILTILKKMNLNQLAMDMENELAALTPECYSRAQCTLQDPERVSGALINVAKHLGNLKFRVWEKMQEIVQYTPVILDPNTAHPGLILSEDLTSVRRGDERQQLPDNPERFDEWSCVVGSEGFNSGTHCWDVEVGDSTWWLLGVMVESLQRKGDFTSKSGCCYIWYEDGKYGARSSPQLPTLLTLKQKLQRIRVQLDWDRGKVSFSDPINNTHLHTIKHTFTQRMFPFLANVCKLSALRIVPVSVRVDQNEST